MSLPDNSVKAPHPSPLAQGAQVLVTGGSRGIGRAAALALADEGAARVTIGYQRDEAAARATVAELVARGAAAEAIAGDVADPATAADLVTRAAAGGRLDVLVCAAGMALEELLISTTDEQASRVFAVNALGALHALRAAAPLMMRQRAGAVVLVSSVAAAHPGRGQSAYAASKGALESLARAAAVELGGKNVRVNAVAPGVVETDMSAELRALVGDELRARIALRRFARPEEIGQVIAFLASPAASYITGAVIPVDGGLR